VSNSELKDLLREGDAATPEGRIVRIMSERGAVSASDVARATGLARSTISMALAELRRARVIVEAPMEEAERGVGRPAALFALNPEAGTCIGLHLGMTDIRMLVADVSHSVICEHTITLGRDYSPAVAAERARRAFRDVYRERGLSLRTLLGVGIAVSGPVAPGGTVQRASIVPTWAGLNIGETFEPVLERPIFADNESNCAAIAEMTWGAAIGCEDFVLFKIDVGVGGAIVSRGQVITGVAGAGGEFGHMTIDPGGDLCRCGNRGCLELTASLNPAAAIASRLHGRSIDISELIAMANAGDVGCARLIADTAEVAGRGLGMIGAILNPGLIILGGRGALAGPLIVEPLKASYERHTLIKRQDVPESQRVKFMLGRFTHNDALMGAVALVLRRHGRLDKTVGPGGDFRDRGTPRIASVG
jgi:predicted NBD/HSP70 family sugar kinase